ncbi:GerMN domain-containing protein [Clostridium nigeriense]|uniref:GerMN domain-containing protein n=1 Tax=Clostridium nigeriense TaxID=1805470 RepID=UPI003D3494E1
MKKKLIAILLSLSIPFSLISCNTNSITNEENSNSTISDNSTSSKEEVENNEVNKDTDQSKEENVKVYYYDGVSDKVVYINTTIEVESDKIADSLIDELKKSPNSDIPPALSSEVTLNSCTVDNENSLVTLDFSSNFVEAQNLGAGAESSTLTAICNTFGSYFNVENVIINLDGKPYSSGHIIMSEGEAFKVDLNSAVELK